MTCHSFNIKYGNNRQKSKGKTQTKKEIKVCNIPVNNLSTQDFPKNENDNLQSSITNEALQGMETAWKENCQNGLL